MWKLLNVTMSLCHHVIFFMSAQENRPYCVTEHHVFDICLQITHLQLGVRPQNFNFGPDPR